MSEFPEKYEPRTPEEGTAAIRAINEARELRRLQEGVEELTTFEIELASRFYREGVREVESAIEKAAGSAAVTIDKDALLAAVNGRWRLRVDRAYGPRGYGDDVAFIDRRVAEIVASARSYVEQVESLSKDVET